MKRILLIFVVAVTLVFMVFPVSAVDGGNAEIEELSDLLDEELMELSENTDLEHFDLVCYDPLINNLNNEEDYIEEPEDELLEEDLIAPYVIGNPDEIDDKELELNSLTVGQLLNQDDGTHFKNLVSVGDETNVSYLNILLDQKYPDCKNIRIHIQGSCSDGEYVYNALNIECRYCK